MTLEVVLKCCFIEQLFHNHYSFIDFAFNKVSTKCQNTIQTTLIKNRWTQYGMICRWCKTM